MNRIDILESVVNGMEAFCEIADTLNIELDTIASGVGSTVVEFTTTAGVRFVIDMERLVQADDVVTAVTNAMKKAHSIARGN